jgi:hypothetical protein
MFRGWHYAAGTGNTPPMWSMDEPSSPYPGIYYVYQGDVTINGKTHNGDPPWNASVLAEPKTNGSSDQSTCHKLGGNISWKLTDIQSFLPGIVLEAGADLTDTANNDAGDGLFGAADQVYFSTSSATLTGTIIAGDQCPDPSNPNSVQGVTITYDELTEIPLEDVIRTTLWLEYVG